MFKAPSSTTSSKTVQNEYGVCVCVCVWRCCMLVREGEQRGGGGGDSPGCVGCEGGADG